MDATSPGSTPRTVAIIGSGAAGSVTAYRLRHLLGSDARLVLYEREDRVGGRARSVTFAGAQIEVGGTLIHSSNRRLGDLLAAAGLQPTAPGLEIDGPAETIAIWDGSSIVFQARTSAAALAWMLVRRYGLRSVLRLRRHTAAVLESFEDIYDLQDAGRLFATPRELLEAIQLGRHTDVSLRDSLASQGVGPSLIGGLTEGILRNMYNQDVSINALAGSVALIGGGFAGGDLYSIQGGNAGLFQRVTELSAAEVRLERRVTAIVPAESPSARGGYAITDSGGHVDNFRAVVIATPLEGSGIDLRAVATSTVLPLDRRFQTVHTTLIAGELNGRFFGQSPGQALPSHVLTTASPGLPFKSIGVTGMSNHGSRIYKIFSGDSVPDDLLDELFSKVHDVHRLVWQAYPLLSPKPNWTPFELADGVYYVNAFESAVSTLETEAVAAWNVAGLAASRLGVNADRLLSPPGASEGPTGACRS